MSRTKRFHGPSDLVRTLNYLAFLPLASRAPAYGRLAYALLRDERVPAAKKAILAGAAAYVASPVDLIPEWIPIVGALDDVVVMVLAIELFLAGLPRELVHEKLDELDIDAVAFDHDRARVRRFIPRPLRIAVARAPGAARTARKLATHSGLDRRMRSWIRLEDRPA